MRKTLTKILNSSRASLLEGVFFFLYFLFLQNGYLCPPRGPEETLNEGNEGSEERKKKSNKKKRKEVSPRPEVTVQGNLEVSGQIPET